MVNDYLIKDELFHLISDCKTAENTILVLNGKIANGVQKFKVKVGYDNLYIPTYEMSYVNIYKDSCEINFKPVLEMIELKNGEIILILNGKKMSLIKKFKIKIDAYKNKIKIKIDNKLINI